MLRILILLIYCAGREAASGDFVDDCDYNVYQTRCGDLCMDYNHACICGGERLNTFSGLQHCCVDPSPDNITQCYIDSIGEGFCPQGSVLNKTEPCHGYCFNEYYASEQIGYDSQFRCGDKCVTVWKMCRGYSGCEDSSDVAACNENLTCAHGRGGTVRHLESDLSDEHFYCSYSETKNDGQYDTITREDEDDLDIRRQKVKIDYRSLTECNYDGVHPGLNCGSAVGGCVRNYNWCRRDISIPCYSSEGTFATNNQGLSSNTTFWQNKTCDKFYYDGDKATLGERCSGGAQHCIYPWYLSSNYYYEVRLALLLDQVTNNFFLE